MRRDDRTFDPTEGTSEIDAIAAQWTQKWIDEGGPSLEIDKIKRREEFRIIDPYIRRLPNGARLLDGGCGMGQWTAYYTGQGYPTVGLDVSEPTIAQLQQLFSPTANSSRPISANRACPMRHSTPTFPGAPSNTSRRASPASWAKPIDC